MADEQTAQTTAAPPKPDAEKHSGGATVFLKGEIEVYTDQPLPHLDQGPSKAFAAKGRNGESAFALLSMKNLVPRGVMAAKYNGVTHPNLPKLLGTGVVTWMPDRQQRYIFVYENKIGRPIMAPNSKMALGLKNDFILNTVVRNIVPVLRDMRDSDFVHGNIRPGNLYDAGSQNWDKMMLGDCLSIPPNYMQTTPFLSIERSLTDPLGRGESAYEDDMFAFGVTLAVMMRHVDPMEGMNPHDILAMRLELGSYVSLLGKERVTGTMLELLRGLLHDDVRLRWNIDDVMAWTDGQRVSAKQTTTPRPKASRPIEFSGKKYIKPQMLAADLPTNPAQCVQIVDNDVLKQWINRSIQDQALEKRYEETRTGLLQYATAPHYPDRMAAYMAMALAPDFPIMYRGLNFMPDGFGRLLVDAFHTRKDLNVYIDIINQQITMAWASAVENAAIDITQILSKFDACRSFLRQPIIGYGLERCIYFMLPEAPCLSEKLKDYYVRTAEELLEAFETMASNGSRPEFFMDRHIAAFLSVRDRGVIDPNLPDIGSEEKHRKILGVMRTFAAIQKRGRMENLPGLTGWLADFAEPLLQRFHDRDLRVDIKTKVTKMRSRGDITKMAELFDNIEVSAEDFKLFKMAIRDHAEMRREYNKLDNDLQNNIQYGYGAGRQFACLISGVIAAIIVLITVFSKLGGGLPF